MAKFGSLKAGRGGGGAFGKLARAVRAAKDTASGRAWSLLHRCESMIALAAGIRRASTHATKKKKKKAKKA